MYCKKCSANLPDNSNFCAYCGSKLIESNESSKVDPENKSEFCRNSYSQQNENNYDSYSVKATGRKGISAPVLFGLIVPFILVVILFAYYFSYYSKSNTSRTSTPQSSSASAINITLDELIRAYKANRTEADTKYRNKNVIITGSITNITSNPPRIVFETGLENFPVEDFLRGGLLGSIYSIVMVFNDKDSNLIANLPQGNIITVEGRFSGLNNFNNLQMNNCRLLPTYMYVNSDTLNIRKGPSSDTAIVGQLTRNNRVQILDTSGQWWKIKYGNLEGYVNSRFLTIEESSPLSSTRSQSAGLVIVQTPVTMRFI